MSNISPANPNQEAVFAFLSDPARHSQVRRIDTHAASVFLEGDRALKIKRAVRFPFLDYSTLEKRRDACNDEIRINKPFAPEIYHRVVPITRTADGSLSIDGAGEPVEFAIEMTRFDENQTLDHLAERGDLNDNLATRMADAIAASHTAAAPAPTEPWIKSIRPLIDGYIDAFMAGSWFANHDMEALREMSKSTFLRLETALEGRGRRGYVRRCHGDLHLANIVLIGEYPVLFDAIEFDEQIASIDVLYDLAFPLMDLLRYRRDAAANRLLNRYLTITAVDHLDGLAALPLFMSMRSAIRAEVLLARLDRSCTDRDGILKVATTYFQLALRLIHPPQPMLVAIGGLSGTGKSVLARALAPRVAPAPGAVLLRSDTLRKQLFGIRETERLPAGAYRPDVTTQVYDIMMQRAARVLSHGHSVVLDAVFAEESERAAAQAAATEAKVRFAGFFLATDLATRQTRVGARKTDASDATPAIAGLQERYDLGKINWASIDASGTAEETLAECQSQLAPCLQGN
jgi:aminoglycoside phosphotransferase family enzyme/predicted kinase